jgi:hypothetical protein
MPITTPDPALSTILCREGTGLNSIGRQPSPLLGLLGEGGPFVGAFDRKEVGEGGHEAALSLNFVSLGHQTQLSGDHPSALSKPNRT